ncbi:MAG: Fic family protein [Rhodospirillales bacterium]|nr:Fic family protein [Rhodospirillales bacterium]
MDIRAADRGESVALMEPLVVGEGSPHRTGLTDLAVELAGKAAGFRRSLPAGVLAALADIVRSMNCYYSNLIEGHDTHPVDIERALRDDYSADPGKRNLQLEARAHIAVQAWIDRGGLADRAATRDGLVDIHRRFCEMVPDDLLRAEDPATGESLPVIPGVLRKCDVKVGRHVPVSPGALPRFLERFESAYATLGRTDSILAAAAAHHRILWIHPFLDGNGRVARLMSHAMLLESLDTGGVWSIARGLARNEDAYKSQLMACDAARRNDLDGRGHLSEETLAAFTRFFLTTCIDQVDFMEGLVQPDRLRIRILIWAEEEIRAGTLPPKSGAVLQAILYRGDLPRGEVAAILGTGERQARRVTSALVERDVLDSDSSRAPLRLAFPARFASRWLPGLFPDKDA